MGNGIAKAIGNVRETDIEHGKKSMIWRNVTERNTNDTVRFLRICGGERIMNVSK